MEALLVFNISDLIVVVSSFERGEKLDCSRVRKKVGAKRLINGFFKARSLTHVPHSVGRNVRVLK